MVTRKQSISSKLFAELFGTLIFVLIGAGSVVSVYYLAIPAAFSLFFVAFATGIALALAVSATMGVSGGHLNPAVTIGAWVAGKIKFNEALGYIVAQIAGATIGAALLLVMFPSVVGNAVFWGTPTLGSSIGIVQAIAIEAILTFILVFVVFGTAIDERAPKIGGFGIGLAVAIDAMIGGSLTGAAMNPARATGPILVSMHFANWYVFWIGPIIGGIVAALIYKNLIMNK